MGSVATRMTVWSICIPLILFVLWCTDWGLTGVWTADGLGYAQYSLMRKGQDDMVDLLDRIPKILAHPEIVIQDTQSPDDTLLYDKRVYVPAMVRHQLLCVVVKVRQDTCYLYNFFPQQSGKVKGYWQEQPPTILYIAPKKRPRDYGLSGR